MKKETCLDSPTRISSTAPAYFKNRIYPRFSSQKDFNGPVEHFICVLRLHHRFNTEYDRSTEAVDTGISEATSIASPSATLGQKYSESCWWLTDL